MGILGVLTKSTEHPSICIAVLTPGTAIAMMPDVKA